MNATIVLLIGYLLGSLPHGYLAGKWLSGIDLREIGSGSTGATNVLRHVGKRAALIVFILDVGKGALAVLLAKAFHPESDELAVFAGLAALIGHIWPCWLNWKGGKAVATGLGMLFGLAWPVGIGSFTVFLSVFWITKIVSLSSILASVSLPLLMLIYLQFTEFSAAYFSISIIAMIIVLWRHRSNFRRILKGAEPRIGSSKNS